MTTRVEIATTDNAFFKLLEVPWPLTHRSLIDAAQKKFKNVTKQSRMFDGISGEELLAADAAVELAPGAKIMVSGKAGWKGAERLRAELRRSARCRALSKQCFQRFSPPVLQRFMNKSGGILR